VATSAGEAVGHNAREATTSSTGEASASNAGEAADQCIKELPGQELATVAECHLQW
jgi:hypothetical protein